MPKADGYKNLEKGKWKPGQSGNPEGPKPGYRQARTVLKELLSVELDDVNPLTGVPEVNYGDGKAMGIKGLKL